MWPSVIYVFGRSIRCRDERARRRTPTGGPLLSRCTLTRNCTSRIIQRVHRGGTVQRALVTVTSSGTTFLTLARARPALSVHRSPSPFVSLSSSSPLPPLSSSRSSRSPGLRPEKDTNDARVRAKHTDFSSGAKQTKRGRAKRSFAFVRLILNDPLCSCVSDTSTGFPDLDFSPTLVAYTPSYALFLVMGIPILSACFLPIETRQIYLADSDGTRINVIQFQSFSILTLRIVKQFGR